MDRIEILNQIEQLAKQLSEEDLKEAVASLQRKLYQAEDKYENIEEIEALACEVLSARECFVYLVNTGALTKEQFSAFENLVSNCDEFSKYLSFYAPQIRF